MEVKNSLSELLRKMFVADGNYASMLTGLTEAATSQEDTISITLERADGNTETVSVPSFHYLESAVKRIEANLDAMSNANSGGSAIRLSDGTYRKLVTVKLPAEADSVVKMDTANNFYIKSNYFFENMINPLLCTSFDITGQVSSGVRQVLSRRFILGVDTPSKKAYFDTYLKGRSDIVYSEFLTALNRYGISYVLDEEVKDIPLKSKRYSGTFSVLNIFNATEDGVTRKFVRLDKLSYTDTQSDYTDTMQLAVGDVLEVAQGTLDTRYKITHVDTSATTVTLELLEGFKPVRVGEGYFRLSAEASERVSVEVTVGFSEYCVVFLKAADENSGILAAEWSPGSGFYTNDLMMTADDGTEVSLQQFYMRNCADFGEMLLSYQNDFYPTSSQAVTPDAPVLRAEDLEVVQINKQVTDNDDIRRIKEIATEKASLSAEISAKSDAIAAMKTKINATVYPTEQARANDSRELQNLVSEYNALVTEYSAKVSTITSLAQSSSVTSAAPKYHIRGFFAMPAEKTSPATGTQALIKFITRYRYLDLNGNSNAVEEIAGGAFSNWTMTESQLRPRVKGKDGRYYWKEIDTADSQEVNINQVDIPITKGEAVEIQVRSVSEAGYPANPAMSEWSDVIRITFPEELSVSSPAESIVSQNTRDSAQMLINNTLVTRGIISHIADSFSANQQTFTHTAHSLFSGFRSADQQPIDLFTKLNEMQSTINNLLELVSGTLGEMSVDITDEDGNAYPLKENTLVSVYAGSYVSAIASETVKRGSIMTKTFWINIRNTAQSGLRLYATYIGMRGRTMPMNGLSPNPQSGIYQLPFYEADTDTSGYDNKNYGIVPVNINSPQTSYNGITDCGDGWQSAQFRNQFIAFRYKDVSATFEYYKKPASSYEGDEFNLLAGERQIDNGYAIDADNGNPAPVWNGTFDANGNPVSTASNKYSPYCVSMAHPYVESLTAWLKALSDATGISADASQSEHLEYDQTGNAFLFDIPNTESVDTSRITSASLTALTLPATQTATQVATSAVRRVTANGNKFNRPMAYTAGVRKLKVNDNGSLTDRLLAGTFRLGYQPVDKYLIGKNTCTSYLYPSVSSRDILQVNGDSANSQQVVASQDSIAVPLVFQARMTDYYGVNDNDTGHYMGDASITSPSGLRVANRIGFDIGTGRNGEVRSFDLEVYADYSNSGNISSNTRLSVSAINSSAVVSASAASAATATAAALDHSISYDLASE